LQEEQDLLRESVRDRKANAYPNDADDEPVAQFIQVIGKW
jgi:hypothetical protein